MNDEKIYLECINSKSKKFYEISLCQNQVFIRAGRIDCLGRFYKNIFDTPDEAREFYFKQINKKFKRGYSIPKLLKKFTQLSFLSEIDILRFNLKNKDTE